MRKASVGTSGECIFKFCHNKNVTNDPNFEGFPFFFSYKGPSTSSFFVVPELNVPFFIYLFSHLFSPVTMIHSSFSFLFPFPSFLPLPSPSPFFISSVSLFFFPSSFPSSLFVSPELSSVRDYVITHSVRSMYVYVCGILQNWSMYPHTLMYCHGTWTQWSLGRVTHVTSTNMWSKVI